MASSTSGDSASPHVASLTKSFAVVPPAAVPAIIDCVLASASLPPSQLFSSLLGAFPSPTQIQGLVKGDYLKLDPAHSNFMISYTTALLHLIKNTQTTLDSSRLFIWRAIVPLLQVTSLNNNESLIQIEELLCDFVIACQSWAFMEATLVPFCLRSMGLSIGMPQSDELSIYYWSKNSCIPSGDDEFSDSDSLPLSIACRILTSLLDVALRERGLRDVQSDELKFADGLGSLEGFARNLVWDLSRMAVDMVSQCLEHRSCAIHLLLPSVFRAFIALPSFEVSVHGSNYVLSRECFFKKIWKCCKSLLTLGHLERLDAYSVLSLNVSFFLHMEDCEHATTEEFDIRVEKEFWAEIRRGLVDKDASVRKQSLYILKILLGYISFPVGGDGSQHSAVFLQPIINNDRTIFNDRDSLYSTVTKRGKWADKEAKSLGVGEIHRLDNCCLIGSERWKAFLLLYEMLEEYGTHLVEAAWTHQISLFFQSGTPDTCMNHDIGGIDQIQMGTLEGILSWLAVLWERGFFHENPQVRCLLMQSFLDVDWENVNFAKQVPKSFVLGPLIFGLNDVVHHKDFGLKGFYNSRTIQGATKFLCQFCAHFSLRERVTFVCSLASVARQDSFGRAGLMALAFCLSSAACRTQRHSKIEEQCWVNSSPEVGQVESAQENLLYSTPSELLDVLGIVIERCKQHFNSNYRLQVCEQVLKAASSVVCTSGVPLDVLLHFLSIVPREFTDFCGPLRSNVQQWFSCGHTGHCCSSYVGTEVEVLQNLFVFPTSFIKHQLPPDVFVSYDDEDLNAWGFEAQRWARVLFLIITEEQHLEPIYMFLQNYGNNLRKQDAYSDWVPAKFFILTLSLVEELKYAWKKFICIPVARGKTEVCMTNIVGQLPPHAAPIVFEKFGSTFLFILEELMSFAESVCAIFWSAPMIKDVLLPCSVKGKLGGPSQRRLAPLETTAVLQAILSMKTVGCIASWFTQLKKHGHVDSLFTFLWNFSWKVIQCPTYESEAGAEIHLAAYEALVPVLKALSTAFSPLAIDYVVAYNKASFPSLENKPFLDPLVLNFLWNINNLLAESALTRSRRAVLMNWKWFCLDSLLSVPFGIFEEGDHPKSECPFFSHSTLRSAFSDIVESLENAGESSVLPMLRSVRLTLELFCAGRMNSVVSSFDGVNCEMLLQLVHSSWILHLSCNKRRVAPIAALLSSVLHPSVFGDLSMHEMECNKQGPIKWFIEKLIDEGVKSPRTIRLTALHLTGLWLLYPRTVKFYIKELKLLSLYGSVAFDEDFEAELSDNHDARLEVSLLAQTPDSELTGAYINTEMYARVAIAVLLYKLAELADTVEDGKENDDTQAARHGGKMFLLELLDSVVNDKDLAKELYKKYSGVHRRKVRAWQMICILSRFVDKDVVQQVTSILHICLYRNNLPAVRQYLETFAIQIYLKFPSLAEEQLTPIFEDYNMRPQALSSYVFIAANIILHASEKAVQLRHLNELLPRIIPLLTSHHHSLRGFTQLLVYHVLCKLMPSPDPNNLEVVPLEKKCFEYLKLYLAENVDCSRLRASMQGILDAFDPTTAATPVGVFGAQNEGSEFECVPTSLMEHVITFLNDVREDLRYSMTKDAMTIKNESLTVSGTCNNMAVSLNGNAGRISSQTPSDSLLDFQKKVTLCKHERHPPETDVTFSLDNAEFPRLLLEMEKEDKLLSLAVHSRSAAIERLRGSRQQFILVASLLDRIPNLAGIARTCEVFKAAGLAIADASIVRDKQFQLISVTAEKWVPIIEVPVSSMKVFIEKKKLEGFTVLGLEQTANSTPLDQYSFPKKMVLVLGHEKEGIPVDIIHVLDACVEIPQQGVIRSLNVHVSGAIALWEYTQQHRCK